MTHLLNHTRKFPWQFVWIAISILVFLLGLLGKPKRSK